MMRRRTAKLGLHVALDGAVAWLWLSMNVATTLFGRPGPVRLASAESPVVGVLAQPLYLSVDATTAAWMLSSREGNKEQPIPIYHLHHLQHQQQQQQQLLRQQRKLPTKEEDYVMVDTGYDYIAASYIKWLEAGGARAVVVPYHATVPSSSNERGASSSSSASPLGASIPILDDLYGQIHGLLLPGGTSRLPESVVYLLDRIRRGQLEDGDFFPVWGTCLGFEFLMQYMAHRTSLDSNSLTTETTTTTTTTTTLEDWNNTFPLESGFDAENISLALDEVIPWGLYRDPELHQSVTEYNLTLNNHHQGISPQRFAQVPSLSAQWQITSINQDRAGRWFVSTVEPWNATAWPWYGVQYHPEKNAFEYGTYPGTNIPYEVIDHSERGLQLSRSLSQFFVGLTRQVLQDPAQRHAYTQPRRFPIISSTYEMVRWLSPAFEEIYLIPRSSSTSSTSS